jgi:sugar/nucleoside kinase (ribokinase family)
VGGAGANAAVWAAAEGAAATLCGKVGADFAGRLATEALEVRGVAADLAIESAGATGALLAVRRGGERSMVADRGANGRLRPTDLPPSLEADAVLVSGYVVFDANSEAAALAAFERARARFVAVDAASWPLLESYGARRFLESTRRAFVLLANSTEMNVLASVASEEELRRTWGFDLLVTKRDAEGAVCVGPEGSVFVPAPDVDIVDPTGAGDAFDGAFLAALARGDPPERAVERGVVAGARAVTVLGAWPPEPAAREPA